SDLWISLALAYFGIGSLAFYLASSRFPHNVEIRQTFPPRYILILCFCALLAVIWRILLRPSSEVRLIAICSVFGLCLALATTSIYPSVTGPFMTALQKYRFLYAAEKFRNSCSNNEALAYDIGDWSSPVILCKQREFAEGVTPINFTTVWHRPPDKPNPP